MLFKKKMKIITKSSKELTELTHVKSERLDLIKKIKIDRRAVLRIRFILIWIRIQIRPKIGKISTFVILFLYEKYISPKYDLFCYLWGRYLSQ